MLRKEKIDIRVKGGHLTRAGNELLDLARESNKRTIIMAGLTVGVGFTSLVAFAASLKAAAEGRQDMTGPVVIGGIASIVSSAVLTAKDQFQTTLRLRKFKKDIKSQITSPAHMKADLANFLNTKGMNNLIERGLDFDRSFKVKLVRKKRTTDFFLRIIQRLKKEEEERVSGPRRVWIEG